MNLNEPYGYLTDRVCSRIRYEKVRSTSGNLSRKPPAAFIVFGVRLKTGVNKMVPGEQPVIPRRLLHSVLTPPRYVGCRVVGTAK